MNILVTGGAGFIGSHLVDALVGCGHLVTVLDDLSTGKESNLAPECRMIIGDIRDPSCVDRSVRGQDVIFHLAAYTSVPGSVDNPQVCFEINVEGTRNVLQQACDWGVKKVVFSSSSAVYPGDCDRAIAETTPPDPESPYAASKLESERLLERFHRDQGLSYVVLRYFNVYGPRQDTLSDYASVIPLFITRSMNGETPTIFGDGHQTRDFVYVTDVASANLRAMDTEICGVFNVGTGQPISILCLGDAVAKSMGSVLGFDFANPRPGDILASTADISSIAASLGWQPEWVLEAGLESTIAWYRAHHRKRIASC